MPANLSMSHSRPDSAAWTCLGLLVVADTACDSAAQASHWQAGPAWACQWSLALGSGLRYMICVTHYCTLRESENLLPCKNSIGDARIVCYSRMAVGFFTCATCKNCDKIWYLGPLPTWLQTRGFRSLVELDIRLGTEVCIEAPGFRRLEVTQKVPMLVCYASGIQLVPIHELSQEIFMNQFSVDWENSGNHPNFQDRTNYFVLSPENSNSKLI